MATKTVLNRLIPPTTAGLSLASTVDVFRANELHHVMKVMGEVLVGAVMAFFMELTEYLLVSYTSSLTLSVSGIVKVRYSFQRI
jgi:solute carrier family 35, member C2